MRNDGEIKCIFSSLKHKGMAVSSHLHKLASLFTDIPLKVTSYIRGENQTQFKNSFQLYVFKVVSILVSKGRIKF